MDKNIVLSEEGQLALGCTINVTHNIDNYIDIIHAGV